MIKVAINGFGRIGRATARHILESRPDMQLVKINATGDLDTNLHLLKFDSVHGRLHLRTILNGAILEA